MKLIIDKISISPLTADQLNNIVGGGERRSDRLHGGCAYSRRNREYSEILVNSPEGDGLVWVRAHTGCKG